MESHNLKDKLQNRTIAPSSNSWDKLNDKLTLQEKKETSKKWLFLKYAAVAVIFITAGFLFFQSKEEIKENPIIVSPTIKEDLKIMPTIEEKPETEVAISPKPILNNKTKNKKSIIKEIEKPVNINEEVAYNKEPLKPIEKEEISTQFEHLEFEHISAIAENNDQNNNKIEQNLDAEIEDLLLKATIKRTNNQKKLNKRAISANDLLFEVEEDLDKDLKQKLFETIVNTLKNPKEVVTDIGN